MFIFLTKVIDLINHLIETYIFKYANICVEPKTLLSS